MGGYGMAGGYGLGGIFMVLWWVLIIAGIVMLVKRLNKLSGADDGGNKALDILKERYARGERSTSRNFTNASTI